MGERDYRTIRFTDLARGLNDSRNETLLRDGESPDLENIELNRDSVLTSRGALKFNNQIAPRSAIRTRVPEGLPPLMISADKGCPLRGYAYIPYAPELDLGGDFAFEGSLLAGNETYHNRRGRAEFELNVTFRIPEEERFFPTPRPGSDAATGTDAAVNGYDEALDECFCIVQKGGDRTAQMSWALAVVNVGQSIASPADRVSNYGLVFMWLDAAEWGAHRTQDLKYNLTDGQNPTSGGDSEFATLAYRAILIEKFVEPGQTYHVALQLKIDTGSPGGLTTSTNWSDNGFFRVWVSQEGEDPDSFTADDAGGGPTVSGLQVYKGPDDSIEYLLKYGVRYSGRDAMFLGLGYRFLPWSEGGFIPYGADSAPLQNGGWSMVDRSATSTADLFPSGYTLTATHSSMSASMSFNHQGLTDTNDAAGRSPCGPTDATSTLADGYAEWRGLGYSVSSTSHNAQALKGYRAVFPGDAAASVRGAVVTLEDYDRASNSFTITDGGTWSDAITNEPALIQAFRWNQRELDIAEVRIWSETRDYAAATAETAERRKFSLRSSIAVEDPFARSDDEAPFGASLGLDDRTEPDIGSLIAYWPSDDAEGAVLRELVSGRDGFLAPFGLGVSRRGRRGENMVFLSGEGEAVSQRLTDNPVFVREFERFMQSGAGGFAMEMSCILPEAYYQLDAPTTPLPDGPAGTTETGYLYAPTLMGWGFDEPDDEGLPTRPRQLLTLSHRHRLYGTTLPPGLERRPAMFSVFVRPHGDQVDLENIAPQDLQPWYRGAGGWVNRYALDAPWVGRYVTIQVGVQSRTGVEDEFDVYISVYPKSSFLPEDGDEPNAELSYWTDGSTTYVAPYDTYYAGPQLTIKKHEFVRSLITVGGANEPGSEPYTQLNARVILDEVRFFAAPAPGKLPAVSGDPLTTGDGKLVGSNALPQRALESTDILQELGDGVRAADFTEGSTAVEAPGNTAFYTGNTTETPRGIRFSYLLAVGDTFDILEAQTLGRTQEEFYFITQIAADGSSLTLATNFADASRDAAAAYAFRLVGYTAFADASLDKELTLGKGEPYVPGTTKSSGISYTDDYFANRSPVTGNFSIRFFSPLGQASLNDVRPSWVRGLVAPRRNPILGLESVNGRIYATCRGALYRVSDRWLQDAPGGETIGSLQFFFDRSESGDAALPKHADRVEFSDATGIDWTDVDATTGRLLEAWVRLDGSLRYQTILYIGDPTSNPAADAGASGHRVHTIMRLNNGAPELLIGSTETYDGSSVPPGGLYSALASVQVPPNKWTKIGWRLYQSNSTWVGEPDCFVNGKPANVSLSARGNGAGAGQWLTRSLVVTPTAAHRVILGCARATFESADDAPSFIAGAIQGRLLRPSLYYGWVNSLAGRLSTVRWASVSAFAAATSFDPFVPQGTSLWSALDSGDLVGHKVLESVGGSYGVIRSHPFVSLFHEAGSSNLPTSWALYSRSLFAANGGRVLRVREDDNAGFAGVLPPTTAPTFRVERKPLWKPNSRPLSGSGDPEADPIQNTPAGSEETYNHLQAFGNNYLRQAFHEEMLWSSDAGAGTVGHFGFKCLWRPRSTSGRVPLYSGRVSLESGGIAVECVDGKARISWYDLYLKKEVYVETSTAVFAPGSWHYVYVRKRFPTGDVDDGNWVNSRWTNANLRRSDITLGAGSFAVGDIITGSVSGGTGRVTKVPSDDSYLEWYATSGTEITSADTVTNGSGGSATIDQTPIHPTNDVLCVRRFPKSAPATIPKITFFARTGSTGANFVSFASEDHRISGTTAIGRATVAGFPLTGSTSGTVTSPQPIFVGDMVGMYFQWSDEGGIASGFRSQVYRVTAVTSPTQISVTEEETGTIPDFTGSSGQGGVFTGIGLVKEPDFDDSRQPDDAPYDIELFGSGLGLIETNGVTNQDGEFDSFGYVVVNDADGEDVRVFEDSDSSVGGGQDAASLGSDVLGTTPIYSAGAGPGRLDFDAGRTFAVVHGDDYAGSIPLGTTQPNEDLAVEMGSQASVNSETLYWQFVQAQALLAGTRAVRCAFFDPGQNERSNPGPRRLIVPSEEDASNPSGLAQIVLEQLPVSRQGQQIQVEVYMTPANGASYFEVARVPNGTASVAIFKTEREIEEGRILLFNNGAPPRCSVVGVSQNSMFYGGLRAASDAVVYSKPFRPVSVPLSNLFQLTGGRDGEVRALRNLRGRMVMFTRDVTYRAVVRQGAAFDEEVSSGVGCIARASIVSLDDRLYYLADRGIYVYTGSGVPSWLAHKLEDFFEGGVEESRIERSVGAINRRRNQYVALISEAGDDYSRHRISSEFDHELSGISTATKLPALHRFSRYRDPNLTAIASALVEDAGVERLVGGTEEGFVVWLDRDDATLALLGETAAIWGASSLTVGSGSTTAAAVVSGSLDGDLEGPRGARLRYGTAGSVKEAVCLLAGSGRLHFDRVVAVAPNDGETLTVGGVRHRWETPWLDLGNPERTKRLVYLDVVTRVEGSGTLTLETYVDFGASPLESATIDLTRGVNRVPLRSHGKHFKWVFRTADLEVGTVFEMTEFDVRVTDEDQS